MSDVGGAADAHRWTDYFEKEALSETGRTIAIVTAAYLDEALIALLKAALLPCATSADPLFDGPYAPLGSFSAKIDFAARLGLISSGVAQSLHLVRRLRNDFAHATGTSSFEDHGAQMRVHELSRLNAVATPERRQHFPAGKKGDFLCAGSWLVYWIWTLIDRMPPRCPECGLRHFPATHQKKGEAQGAQGTTG